MDVTKRDGLALWEGGLEEKGKKMVSEGEALVFPDHRGCQTLTGLTLEHLPAHESIGRERRYGKGDHVWLPGVRANTVYFLRQGQVALMRQDDSGREIILRVINEGAPFGELCLCTAYGGVRQTLARAVVASVVLEVSLADFTGFLRQSKQALAALLYTFCVRLSDMERRVEVLAYRGAEDRLGRLLLELAASRGASAEGADEQKLVQVSHDELAQMAAMSRSHVTVTMGRFRRQGLLDYARDRPLVIDVSALEDYLKARSAHE